MTPDKIPISSLNDFLFCPYSLYLHMVYRDTEEEAAKAVLQKAGTIAHEKIAKNTVPGIIRNLPVQSEQLGITGFIDELDTSTGTLTEYKNNLPRIYPGQKIQLQAEYFCLLESGHKVNIIHLVEISTGKDFPLPLPGEEERNNIAQLVERIQEWTPETKMTPNHNKCRKCIYCALCEKTEEDNVF